MRALRTLAILVIIAALPAMAAGRRRAVAPPDDSLSIAFVEAGSGDGSLTGAGSEAWLDLKSVNGLGKSRERVTRIRRRIGVRVMRSGGVAWGTAVITARLESWDGRATFRLDGRSLTAIPIVVDAHAAVGTVVYHTLEIEVPISMPEGPLAASIAWEVTAE